MNIGRFHNISGDVCYDHWSVGGNRGNRLREYSRFGSESFCGAEDTSGNDSRACFCGVNRDYSVVDIISVVWSRIK